MELLTNNPTETLVGIVISAIFAVIRHFEKRRLIKKIKEGNKEG